MFCYKKVVIDKITLSGTGYNKSQEVAEQVLLSSLREFKYTTIRFVANQLDSFLDRLSKYH